MRLETGRHTIGVMSVRALCIDYLAGLDLNTPLRTKA